MALTAKDEKRISSKIYSRVSVVTALVLLVVGVFCWLAGSSIVSMVNAGLAEEKVSFPAAGSAGFTAALYPDAQQYAGQAVNDGNLAKAYADTYLTPQMKLLGGGKTVSEITDAAVADPTNAQLQQLQGVMFQLDTTKGMLLSSGYGSWAQGVMLEGVGMAALAGGVVLLLVGGAMMMQYRRAQ